MRILLSFFVLIFLGACDTPESPEFKKLQKVSLNSFSMKKPYSVTLDAEALLHNPNPIGANITEVEFDVFINEVKSTHVYQKVSAEMPASSDFVLPIECDVPLEDVFRNMRLKEVLKARKVDYRLDGHFQVGVKNVELKVPFTSQGEKSLQL